MLQLVCVVLAAIHQENGAASELDGPSVAEEIEELIGKTNALGSFLARYRVEVTEDGKTTQGSIDVGYAAPDRGRVRGNFEDTDFDVHAWGGRYCARAQEGDEVGFDYALDMPFAEAARTLAVHFPPQVGALGGGASFVFQFPGMGSSDDGNMNLQLEVTLIQREILLSWLAFLREHAAEVQRDGAELLWTGEATTASFSRETGFLTHAEFVQGEGKVVGELESLALEGPVDEFLESDGPAFDKEPDESAALSIADSSWTTFREALYRRAESCLSSGRVEWNEETRAEWRSVLASFQRELLTTHYREWMESRHEWATDYAARIQSFIEEDPPIDAMDELREQVEESRQKLVETLSSVEQDWMDARPEVRPARSGNPPRSELFEIEDELLPTIFQEIVAAPLLQDFDEQLDAAFDP